jgi:hypothetical protein
VVGRSGHRDGGDALLGKHSLVQTQVRPADGLVLAQEPHNAICRGVHYYWRDSAVKKSVARGQRVSLPLIPNNVGYSTNAPLSSHTILVHAPGTFPSGPGSSSSFLPQATTKHYILNLVHGCTGLLHLLNSCEGLLVLPISLVKNEKIRICRSGRENVTKDDESGESVIHVGVDFDCKRSVGGDERQLRTERKRTFLNSYKSVTICLALEWPQLGHVGRQLELLARPPVLDKATFIR